MRCCVHVCVYACMRLCMYACMYECVKACLYVFMIVHSYVHPLYTFTYADGRARMLARKCLCACGLLCLCTCALDLALMRLCACAGCASRSGAQLRARTCPGRISLVTNRSADTREIDHVHTMRMQDDACARASRACTRMITTLRKRNATHSHGRARSRAPVRPRMCTCAFQDTRERITARMICAQ